MVSGLTLSSVFRFSLHCQSARKFKLSDGFSIVTRICYSLICLLFIVWLATERPSKVVLGPNAYDFC